MREVVVRVPGAAVEEVLDRLLPIVPGGVREQPRGRHVELTMRGAELPSRHELERAVGRWRHTLVEREVPEDWRERRVAAYRPEVIGGRLILRPAWAPATEGRAARVRGGAIQIELAESKAFGTGTHPTTRVCLETLLGVSPRGSFADLGCGSGVLAILAAKLGWEPVTAIDVQPESIEAVRQNAACNAVAVDARRADLAAEAAPYADGFAANVPAAVHASITSGWAADTPEIGLISGFTPVQGAAVVDTYLAIGLRELERVEDRGWTVIVLGRM